MRTRRLRTVLLLVLAAAACGVAPARAEAPTVVAQIRTGLGPCVAIEAFGWVWVSNNTGSTVARVNPRTNRVKGVGMRIYIEAADNIDQVAARAKASGIALTREPHDTEWGNRAFEVTEPSGFLLTIGSTPKAD